MPGQVAKRRAGAGGVSDLQMKKIQPNVTYDKVSQLMKKLNKTERKAFAILACYVAGIKVDWIGPTAAQRKRQIKRSMHS